MDNENGQARFDTASIGSIPLISVHLEFLVSPSSSFFSTNCRYELSGSFIK